jgi:hypothetical protein
LSTNKTVQAMHLGATLRREGYEDILEDLCLEVTNRLESNPEFKTKEIIELVETVEKMLEIVLEDGGIT